MFPKLDFNKRLLNKSILKPSERGTKTSYATAIHTIKNSAHKAKSILTILTYEIKLA